MLLPLEARMPELDVCVVARPESASALRFSLRRFLDACNLSAEQRYDVLIATGEAASNAIEHAYRGAHGEIRLRATLAGGGMTIEVHDAGTWRLDGDPERGRGLSIMRALMDSVDIVSSRTGTLVRLHLRAERFDIV